MKNEILTKLNEIMSEENELMVLRGQLMQPAKHVKETGEVYYTFSIKTLKKLTDDLYSTSYNTYFIVMPSAVSVKYSDEEIQNMKGNEVICMLDTSCRVKNLKSTAGETYKVNHNINLYCIDLMQVRSIDKTIERKKVISL